MTQDEVYEYIQDIFRTGLVMIVGSGASCAYGLPSMSDLTSTLTQEMPARVQELGSDDQATWTQISDTLTAGVGLEDALDSVGAMSDDMLDAIVSIVADAVATAEHIVLDELLHDRERTAYGKLLGHILRTNNIADIVTTNYDRLIEVSAILHGHRVDTMFYGHTIGRLDKRLASEELLVPRSTNGRRAELRLERRPHIRLSKPHGSLDWHSFGSDVVRSELSYNGTNMIVAPGGHKYRRGYDVPFDAQRERANEAIDKATAVLTIGYGFNDEHLQTHLLPKFANVPAVILGQSLTPRAREYLATNTKALGIERAGPNATTVTRGQEQLPLENNIWDIAELMKEVLGL